MGVAASIEARMRRNRPTAPPRWPVLAEDWLLCLQGRQAQDWPGWGRGSLPRNMDNSRETCLETASSWSRDTEPEISTH